MIKKVLLMACIVLCSCLNAFAADIEHAAAKQINKRLLFEFDITGTEYDTEVIITLTMGNRTYTADDLTLAGDYGKVRVGEGKQIYWDVLSDFPEGYIGGVNWEIKTKGTAKKGIDAVGEEKKRANIPLPSF